MIKFKEFNNLDKSELENIKKVLDSKVLSGFLGQKGDNFLGGKYVRRFENKFKEYVKCKYSISVNSWTSGLIACVGSIGVEPGDEIILSPWTMSACAMSILHWNCIPIFADIDPQTFNIDPKSIEKNITKKTKAIMVIDIFGHPAPYKEILKIAKKNKLRVISDSAQSLGAKYYGKHSGIQSDIGGYSFNVHKHLNTGEGGMIVTNNKLLAERCRILRNHGENIMNNSIKKSSMKNMIGFNFRMTEIESAIGLAQLKKLKYVVKSKQLIAKKLNVGLDKLKGLKIPKINKNCTSTYYNYALIIDDKIIKTSKKDIIKKLRSNNIPVSGSYMNLHLLPIFKKQVGYGTNKFPWSLNKKKYEYKKGDCPIAENMNDKWYIGLNMWKYDYNNSDINYIVNSFKKVWSSLKFK